MHINGKVKDISEWREWYNELSGIYYLALIDINI